LNFALKKEAKCISSNQHGYKICQLSLIWFDPEYSFFYS